MFLCQMMFFYKMAVLITLTIGFSFVFSFGFFMTYLAMIGPEYDNGNLGAFCGQSLVEHAVHTVQETKDAKNIILNKNENEKDIELISVNSDKGNTTTTTTTSGSGNDQAELSGADILNWGKEDKNEE